MQNKNVYKQEIKNKFIANQIIFTVAEIINEGSETDIFDYGDIVNWDFFDGKDYNSVWKDDMLKHVPDDSSPYSYPLYRSSSFREEISLCRDIMAGFYEIYPEMQLYCNKSISKNAEAVRKLDTKKLEAFQYELEHILENAREQKIHNDNADSYKETIDIFLRLNRDTTDKTRDLAEAIEEIFSAFGVSSENKSPKKETLLDNFSESKTSHYKEVANLIIDCTNWIVDVLVRNCCSLIKEFISGTYLTKSEEIIVWKLFHDMIDNPSETV